MDPTFPAYLRRPPQLQAQLDELWAMTADERVAAMRAGRLTYYQLCAWSSSRPHEVPCVTTGQGGRGEFEWIAAFEPSNAEAHDAAPAKVAS